jgi:hypothetical protein
MSSTCAQCGAIHPSGETCQQRFEACLALEYENPSAYGAVHLLTVACYMLQHNLYSRQGWLETRQMVAQIVHQEATPIEIREKYQRKLDSGQRTWSVTRGARLAEFDAIQWSFTIADLRMDNPEGYVTSVKQWAEYVLEDTDWIRQG